MLSEKEMERIIESLGMKMHVREQHNKRKGDGKSREYIRASKDEQTDHGKVNILIDLGRIEKVAQMSQEELTEAIKQKFAEKLRLKSQASNK